MDASFTGSLASLGSGEDSDEEGPSSRLRQVLQDQILRTLMLNSGLLEDFEAGRTIADLGATSTLRSMRRTGPLGDVGEDGQTTLLGSTLYEYSDLASPSRAADARAAALGATLGATASAPSASPLAPMTEEFTRLRLRLDRILQEGSQLGSTIDSTGSASFADTVRHLRLAASQSASSAGGPDGSVLELETPRSRTGALLEGDLSLMEEELLRMIRTGGGDTPGHFGDTLLHATANVPLGESLPRLPRGALAETLRSPMSSRMEDSVRSLENSAGSSLLVGLGGAAPGPGDTLFASQALESEVPEETSGDILESFTAMLQRLAGLDVASLDESLARGVRRVLQMGAVLAGARLADDEIRDLPKVRFDQAEEQKCAICLESFKSGELLTELPCRHFFHVDCVALWFQRSTRCPLCRSGCHVEASLPPSAEADERSS